MNRHYNNKFVVVFTSSLALNSDEPQKYLAFDVASGGYPYWTTFMSDARIYTTEAAAKEAISGSEFRKNVTVSGVTYPPQLIQSALDINNAKTRGSGYLCICAVNLEIVSREDFKAEIITNTKAQKILDGLGPKDIVALREYFKKERA